jgi:phosphoserine phosphatase RsbX
MDGMSPNTVEWGVAAKQLPGEALSGDLHLVKPTDKGILVAVADGLGHGREAAEAAKLALDAVDQSAQQPLVQVLEHCSRSLRRTRGVVMSLALLSALDDTMEWLGVGNVEGLLVREPSNGKPTIEFLMLSQGVVGIRLPPLRTTVVKVAPGDTLVVVTDGIRRGFDERVSLIGAPGEIARGILARDCLGTDDALVLVATYKGRPR